MPTVALPPTTLFTFQMAMEFVPPWMKAWNCCLPTTFTETVAGEIVTLIFVTGSVHVEVEVAVEEVEVLVVQVTAVLAGALWHEAALNTAMSEPKNRRRFTAPLASFFEIPNPYSSVSTDPLQRLRVVRNRRGTFSEFDRHANCKGSVLT